MIERKRKRTFLRLVAAVCLVNLTTGCFVAQPIDEAPGVRSEVQVRLTREGAQRISRQAAQPVEGVAGRVLQVDSDSLVLAVRWREVAGGSSGRPGPDVVRLAHSEIEDISQSRFSLTRTIFLTGGVVLLAAAVIGGWVGQGAGDPGEDGDGDPNPR